MVNLLHPRIQPRDRGGRQGRYAGYAGQNGQRFFAGLIVEDRDIGCEVSVVGQVEVMGTSRQRGPCDRIAIIAATLKRTRGVYDDEGGLGCKPVSEIVRVRVQLSGAAGGARAKSASLRKAPACDDHLKPRVGRERLCQFSSEYAISTQDENIIKMADISINMDDKPTPEIKIGKS